MTCPYCGDEHDGNCWQRFSSIAADREAEAQRLRTEADSLRNTVASLTLEAASLRHTLIERDMTGFGPWRPYDGA